MKQIKYIISGVALLLFLTACQADMNESPDTGNNQNTESEQVENNEMDEVDEPNEVDEPDESDEVAEDDDQEEAESEDNDTDVDSFEEMEVVEQYIDLSVYQYELLTDNQNKRVMLFKSDQSNKEYKSIFIKNKNRLKIIHLGEDGLIFNDKID